VMQDGRLHQWADAATLYQQPASRFVADFIGHGAFVPATVAVSPQGCTVETPLGLLSPGNSPLRPGRCELLLRASDVVCDTDAPTRATLVRKAFRGAQTLYTLELPSGHTVYAQEASGQPHALGEQIGVRAQPQQWLVF